MEEQEKPNEITYRSSGGKKLEQEPKQNEEKE